MHDISKFQLVFFREMIPSSIREVWKKGLDHDDYKLKLCGAGGGGYFLGYSQKDIELEWDTITKVEF